MCVVIQDVSVQPYEKEDIGVTEAEGLSPVCNLFESGHCTPATQSSDVSVENRKIEPHSHISVLYPLMQAYAAVLPTLFLYTDLP